jgi:hypothetical protein
MKKLLGTVLMIGVLVIGFLIGCSQSNTEATSGEGYVEVGEVSLDGITRRVYMHTETNCAYFRSNKVLTAVAEQKYDLGSDKCYGYYQDKYGEN